MQIQIDKLNKSIARKREKSGDVTSGQTKCQNSDSTPPETSLPEEKSEEKGGKEHSEDDIDTGDFVKLQDIDLTHEAVFNMSQIYEACGSEHLARQLLYQYAVVWH